MKSPEMQPQLTEAGQNALTITINGRNIVVPRKELYGISDIGNAIGSGNEIYTRSRLSEARKNNPDINPLYLRDPNFNTRRLFLSEKDFILAVTMIIPTIKGNGLETRPKGHTLRKDQAQKADVQKEAKQQINSLDPQEKVIFLKKTFAILSDPDPRSQDKRDAALDMLLVMDLTNVNPEKLKTAYLETVNNLREDLNEDSDPYGEIHALLEAGKTIAPFIENSRGIAQSWNRVAKAFTGSDRQKILDDMKEIKRLAPVVVTEFFEFDTNVETLVKKGLRNQDIATELRVEILDILRSISRLKNRGMNHDRRIERKRTPQREQLFKDVKDLRNKGMGNLKIAGILGTSQRKINDIASDLIAEREISRIKDSGPKKKIISS